jgi:hypothetical protein
MGKESYLVIVKGFIQGFYFKKVGRLVTDSGKVIFIHLNRIVYIMYRFKSLKMPITQTGGKSNGSRSFSFHER